mgnify:CR=1 FL=1
MSTLIEFDGVCKYYQMGDTLVKAADHVSFKINKGEFVAIVGQSGSGKSTCMNIIGCLDVPTEGTYLLDGRDVGKMSRRELASIRNEKLGFIFQQYNLLPKLTLLENVEVPLVYAGIPAAQRHATAKAALERVGLGNKLKNLPNQLSGGQQQRVAIARALVNRPKVLLLDEPLAALDLKLRKDMQIELKRIQQQVGITFIYVTHDQEEALTMSDTIVVMDKGSIQQIGTPEDIYNEPKNAFVADFIGESNIIDGIMPEDNVVQMYGRRFPCLDGGFAPNEAVDVVIRPEDIDIVPVEQGQLTGTVTSVTFKGMQYDIIVDFRGFKWLIQTTDHCPEGARIGIKIDPDGIHVMKKSAYSGMFGDYSSFSEEYDELDDATLSSDEEESGDEE